jgi:hypothetical protein
MKQTLAKKALLSLAWMIPLSALLLFLLFCAAALAVNLEGNHSWMRSTGWFIYPAAALASELSSNVWLLVALMQFPAYGLLVLLMPSRRSRIIAFSGCVCFTPFYSCCASYSWASQVGPQIPRYEKRRTIPQRHRAE